MEIDPISGDVHHGVGGGYASISNRAYRRGAAGGWIDDAQTAFMNGDDLWYVSAYNRITGRSQRVFQTEGQFVYAGGGHVTSWVGGQGAIPGMSSTIGFAPKDAYPLAMGPDGSLAYKPQYQSYGPTKIHTLGGDDWELTPTTPGSVHLLGANRAVLTINGGLEAIGLPQPVFDATGGIWKGHAAIVNGRAWYSYFSGARGLVIHPWDTFEGYWIPGGTSWHSIAAIGPILRLAYAISEEEQAGQIKIFDLSLDDGLIREPGGAWMPIPRVDIRSINAAPPIVIPPIDRAVWYGFFEFTPDPSLPGNCVLNVPSALLLTKARDKIIAQYTAAEAEGNTQEAFAAKVAEARARRPDVPVICYWPHPDQAKPIPLTADVVGVEAYQRIDESDFQFELRIRQAVVRCAQLGKQVALIPQCYTSNSLLTLNLHTIPVVAAKIAHDYENVKAVIVFSGSGRPTGLQDHNEVRPLWEQFGSTIGTPTIVTPPPPAAFIKKASSLKGSRMRFYAKQGSKFIGVDPNVPDVVYNDRTNPGAWEAIELTKSGDDYFAHLVEAKRQLSFTPGGLETRNPNTNGPWEKLRAVEMPNGEKWLYRVDNGRVVDVLILQAA